jgi:Zn-dependent M28 family amino/carboxypeptidase
MRLVATTPDSKPVPEAIRGLLDSVSSDDLRSLVEALSVPRVYGTAENKAVRRLIIDRLATSGFAQPSIVEDEEGNVIVGDPWRARVLVGAHYDAVPGTPGADDNASAVAVLLSAARAVGPHAEVCFVTFNGEECDLAGSRAFVGRLGRNRLEQVHVLEMVGYTSHAPGSQRNPIPPTRVPTVGDFLGLVGTHRSRRALDRVLALAGSSAVPVQGLYPPPVPSGVIRRLAPHVLRSDQAPFWEAGIPALMWTDTAEFRNPNYHRSTDLPETLDYEFMAGVTRLLIHVIQSGLGAGGRK